MFSELASSAVVPLLIWYDVQLYEQAPLEVRSRLFFCVLSVLMDWIDLVLGDIETLGNYNPLWDDIDCKWNDNYYEILIDRFTESRVCSFVDACILCMYVSRYCVHIYMHWFLFLFCFDLISTKKWTVPSHHGSILPLTPQTSDCRGSTLNWKQLQNKGKVKKETWDTDYCFFSPLLP